MSISYCKICDAAIYDWEERKHTCPPEYTVMRDWNGEEEWQDDEKVYDFTHIGAAEKAADIYDSNYGEGATEQTISVRCEKTLVIKKFQVNFEYRVDYSAHEIEDE